MTHILAIADTHGWLPPIDSMPEADIFIHAGDITPVDLPHDPRTQAGWIKKRFMPWLKCVPATDKIVIPGNHDFVLQPMVKDEGRFGKGYGNEFYERTVERLFAECHFLSDESATVQGLKIYGTPWVPQFMDWAFMQSDPMLKDKWDMIPDDTDILVVHGPPYGFGDLSSYGDKHVGSVSLRRRMGELNLKLAFFGHIHNGRGIWYDWEDTMLFPNKIMARMHNVAVRDDQYNTHHQAAFKSFIHYMEVT